MRPRSLLALASFVFAQLAVAACGGKVVFEEGGEGGDGSGAGSSAASGTPEGACALLCAKAPQCIGEPCQANCESVVLPGCEAESAALLRCLAENMPADCLISPQACVSEIFAYGECTAGSSSGPGPGPEPEPEPLCTTDSCVGNELTCSCSGSCAGRAIEQECKLSEDGASCACTLDGELVGECFDPFAACTLDGGCCLDFALGG